MIQKWNSLGFSQRFALGSLLLFLLVMPAAVYLALSPTSPFSKAGSCPTSAPDCGTETPATLSLEPSIIKVSPGQSFSVNLVLDTGSHEVSAADITLKWDGRDRLLKYVNFTPGAFLPVVLEKPSAQDNIATDSGHLKFAVGSTSEKPVSGVGTIASLTFQAIAEGGSSINFTQDTQVAAIYQQVNIASNFYPAEIKIFKDATGDNLILNLQFESVASKLVTPLISIDFEPVNPGLQKSSKSIHSSPSADGAHTAKINTPLGDYNVFVKGPAHLRKFVGQMGLSADTVITAPKEGSLFLTVGDIVDNNTIDIFDYNIIVQDFGPRMPETGSPADLDLDGDVDIFDYNLIVQNFGKVGD